MFLSRFFDYYPRDIESVINVTLTSAHRMFMLMMIVLGSTLVLVFNNKIKNWKYEDRVLKIMGIILILNVFGYYVWEGFHGELRGIESLPLTFCPITAMTLGVTLLTRKYWFFPYIFYMGLFGGLMATVFPDDLHAGPFFYRFHHFYIQHTWIIIIPIYLTKAYGLLPSFKETLRGFFITCILGAIGLIVNYLTGWVTYYMLLNPYLPPSDTPLETIAIATNQSAILYTLFAGVIVFLIFMFIYSIPRLYMLASNTIKPKPQIA